MDDYRRGGEREVTGIGRQIAAERRAAKCKTMNVDGVAKGLNGEEREALLSAAICKGGKWYTTHVAAFNRDTSLQRSGILTALGLAVRGHLLKHPTGER